MSYSTLEGRKLENLPPHVIVDQVALTDDGIPAVILQIEKYKMDPRFESRELEGAMPQDIREILNQTDLSVDVWEYLYETAEVGEPIPLGSS